MDQTPLRTDLERVVIDGFALPLGLVPVDGETPQAPNVGYTVEYIPGEGEEPDTYLFYVVVSHERLAGLLDGVFRLLPSPVHPIVEISSRDAYRALDVFMAQDPIPLRSFLREWRRHHAFLLENGWLGCGANGEDPFVEIFLDQWKGISVHVPLLMRDDVERILVEEGLSEVAETWPDDDDPDIRTSGDALRIRSVLAEEDDHSMELDDMLLRLRQAWNLELNIDPETNVDEGGRVLGRTLWHAMVIVEPVRRGRDVAFASIWATAGSLLEMEDLIETEFEANPDWRFAEIYSIDRIAYDERPDELGDLPTVRGRTDVHLVRIDA